MGLDITYVSKIRVSMAPRIPPVLLDVVAYMSGPQGGFSTSYNGCFDYQLGSLKKFIQYDTTAESEIGHFRAGSYSGYNQWRNELSIIAGYDSVDQVWKDFDSNIRLVKLKRIEGENAKLKPFYELINFSDAEGLIGPEICKKLYQDFMDFDDKAKEVEDSWIYEKYLEWKEAFKVASDDGLVAFH
jgi:hypothetical protein